MSGDYGFLSWGKEGVKDIGLMKDGLENDYIFI